MKLEIAFKRLVLVDFAIIILATLSAFVVPVNEELPFTSIDAIALALLVIYLVSLYLLYTFRPLGKILYAPVFIFSIGVGVGYPLEYINPQNYFDYILFTIGPAVSGAIICMLYLTDIKDRFK